jgi:hypothetical protein
LNGNDANWRLTVAPLYGSESGHLNRLKQRGRNGISLSKKNNTFKNKTVALGGSDLVEHRLLSREIEMNMTHWTRSKMEKESKVKNWLDWKFTLNLYWQKELIWKGVNANWKPIVASKYGWMGNHSMKPKQNGGIVIRKFEGNNTLKNKNVVLGGSDLVEHRLLCREIGMVMTYWTGSGIENVSKVKNWLDWKFTLNLYWRK